MLRTSWFVLAVLVFSNVVAAVTTAGTIVGDVRVLVDRTTDHAPRSPFARKRFVDQGESEPAPVVENRNVLVYLAESSRLQPADPPEQLPVINQKELEIIPGFMVVPVGTTVRFPNSDDVYHNLFSVSSAKRFDLGRYGQGREKRVTFDRPGEVRIFCDIHPHINAIVFAVPNRHYALADSMGRFRLEGVPAGEYELRAWHESLGEQGKRVNVPADGVSRIDFVFAEN